MLKKKSDLPKDNKIDEDVCRSAPAEDNAGVLEYMSLSRERIHIVTFHLLQDEYAFEVSDAVEVLKHGGLTSVPRTPEFIRGILSVRGDMVPIFDLKMRLGIGSSKDNLGRILVTSIDDLKVGFIVDRLSGVREVALSSVVPYIGTENGPTMSRFLKGVVSANGMNVSILNLGRLIDISGV
jgi:purine-binding chemotaxis protein CheW